MTIYVLTAEQSASDPTGACRETYLFMGDGAYERANLHALHLIAEYVAGGWSQYNDASVATLRELIEEGHSVEARRVWNNMSEYQIQVTDYEPTEGESGEPNFAWEE